MVFSYDLARWVAESAVLVLDRFSGGSIEELGGGAELAPLAVAHLNGGMDIESFHVMLPIPG